MVLVSEMIVNVVRKGIPLGPCAITAPDLNSGGLNMKFVGADNCTLLSVSRFFSVQDFWANVCPSHFAGLDGIFFACPLYFQLKISLRSIS